MRVSLKLNSIEQEHLQELYDAAGMARDELPYTDLFTQLVEDFQNRTFKNAEPEQVFGAMVKYVRSSTNASANVAAPEMDGEHAKLLKGILRRHAKGGKILPHSSEFDAALKEFSAATKTQLNGRDFWLSIVRTQGRSRRPPKPATAKVGRDQDDDASEDGE
jgi:cytochrome c556